MLTCNSDDFAVSDEDENQDDVRPQGSLHSVASLATLI